MHDVKWEPFFYLESEHIPSKWENLTPAPICRYTDRNKNPTIDVYICHLPGGFTAAFGKALFINKHCTHFRFGKAEYTVLSSLFLFNQLEYDSQHSKKQNKTKTKNITTSCLWENCIHLRWKTTCSENIVELWIGRVCFIQVLQI